jgi:hypothetical protein
MFQAEPEQPGVCDPRTTEVSMSIADKMILWAVTADGPEPESPIPSDDFDWFDGIEEAADLILEPSEPIFPSQVILGSAAYQWMLENLQRVASLRWTEGCQVSPMDTIHHQIIQSLPTARIRKNQGPAIHHAEFLANTRQIMRRYEKEETRRFLENPEDDVSEIIILVSSSRSCIQAATLGEYVNQVWGSRASGILDLMRGARQGKLEMTKSHGKSKSQIGSSSPVF